MLDYDLHCHSTVSDGVLSPAVLVARAAERGVKALALTDHDDVAGLSEAAEAAAVHGIQLINGVEISVSWRSYTLHIVGLNVNPAYPPLAQGLRSIRDGRGSRAQLMADSLARSGIGGALDIHAGRPVTRRSPTKVRPDFPKCGGRSRLGSCPARPDSPSFATASSTS